MLTATYPIKNSSESVTITIETPTDLPPGNKIAQWSISAPGLEIHNHSCGIDDLQCLLLSMKAIAQALKEWEQQTGNNCEYTFYQDIAIVYDPSFKKINDL